MMQGKEIGKPTIMFPQISLLKMKIHYLLATEKHISCEHILGSAKLDMVAKKEWYQNILSCPLAERGA